MNNSYPVIVYKIPELQKAIKKLNKKGGNFAAVTYSDPYLVEVVDVIDGVEYSHEIEYCEVTLEGSYQPASDYVLVALLEPINEEGDNLVHTLTDEHEVPKRYRKHRKECQHCNTKRSRKQYYLVKSLETGEYLQVGSSCLKDFFPVTAQELVRCARWYQAVIDTLEGDDFARSKDIGEGYLTAHALAVALWLAESQPYVKVGETDDRGNELECTRDIVKRLYMPDKTCADRVLPDTADVLEWLSEQENDGDYIYNLKLIVSQRICAARQMGILCSLPSVYLRAKAKAAARELEQADLVDVSEGRYEVEGKIVSFKDYENDYGTTHKMLVQCDGFRLFGTVPKSIWYDAELGDTVRFTAKVDPKETGFAIYSRPSKADIVATAAAS